MQVAASCFHCTAAAPAVECVSVRLMTKRRVVRLCWLAMFSRLLCALLLPACPLFALQAADPQAVLKRAMEVTGFSKFSDKILHTHDTQGVEQDYQSPAPFITMFNQREA